MAKQDSYPAKSTLTGNDYVTGVDSTGPSTIRILISAILSYVWTLANIPVGGTNPITRDGEQLGNYVASGLVITGDSYAVNRNASMTTGIVYINGRRISISPVSARTYTASKDTYVDILDNGDGTGTVVYTEVTNGATSPALAANSVRIGKVVTGATTIAAASSITQTGYDALYNLVYPAGSITAAKVAEYDWFKFIPALPSITVNSGSFAFTAGLTSGNPFYPAYRSVGALNDQITLPPVILGPGTYTIALSSDQDINRGIYALLANGVVTGSTIDGYSASRVANVLTNFTTTFTLTRAQAVVFSIRSTTKNASSSSYVVNFYGLHITRTA